MSEGLLATGRVGIARLRRPFTAHASDRDAVLAHGARTFAICLAAIVVAFRYSLSTLIRTLSLDTPLAYLGLVPLIALGLAILRARPQMREPSIHDRQVDFIVGVPLLLAALAIVVVLPGQYSVMFWVWRIDLVALPLFVAGAVGLLFGVRTLWRVKLAVAFLFLAWPLPYTALLLTELQQFTDLTIAAVKLSLHVVPVAHPAAGLDGSQFIIEHGRQGFPVSVATACSGVNGMVGYALVSAAFLALVKGKILLKAAWLTLGLVMIWLLNVVRIVGIFVAGKVWGESVAIDGLHPFLGLVTFCVGVLIMLLLLKPFRLDLPARSIVDRERESSLYEVRRAVPKTRLAVVVVVAFALLTGAANASLKSFDLVANVDGTPKLQAFLTRPAVIPGWRAAKADSFEWAKQFFGSDSSWYRYTYSFDRLASAGSELRTTAPVVADVIQTSDLSSFSAYGIEACYSFHGYHLNSVERVDLGGVIGRVVTYRNTTTRSDWTNVYWIWPVQTPSGETRYERVNLLLTDSSAVRVEGSVSKSETSRALGREKSSARSSHEEKVRLFLVTFASQIVHRQAKLIRAKS